MHDSSLDLVRAKYTSVVPYLRQCPAGGSRAQTEIVATEFLAALGYTINALVVESGSGPIGSPYIIVMKGTISVIHVLRRR